MHQTGLQSRGRVPMGAESVSSIDSVDSCSHDLRIHLVQHGLDPAHDSVLAWGLDPSNRDCLPASVQLTSKIWWWIPFWIPPRASIPPKVNYGCESLLAMLVPAGVQHEVRIPHPQHLVTRGAQQTHAVLLLDIRKNVNEALWLLHTTVVATWKALKSVLAGSSCSYLEFQFNISAHQLWMTLWSPKNTPAHLLVVICLL